jgi:hypothetical protein
MPQVNPKTTKVALNGSGGAYVDIALTILASKAEIQEDPNLNAGTAQGLTGFYLDPDSSHAAPAVDPANDTVNQWLPNTTGQNGRAYQPIIFGGMDGRVDGGKGNYVGAAGTPLLRIRSSSATATGILLVEWP